MAHVGFTDLQAQFIGQILGQVTRLPVLQDILQTLKGVQFTNKEC